MALADQFYRVLGRAPTQDEVGYFSKFTEAGELQPEEIGQILQSLPEFQGKQLGRDTDAFGQRLQANDSRILQEGADIAGAQATSRFAGLGRPNSSAMAAQVFGQTGQLANSLAQSRQSALAQFYGQGMQNNAALGARQGQEARERGYGLRDESRERGYQIEDRNYMKGLYDEYSNRQSRSQRKQALGGGIAGIAGGLGGAYLGSFAGPGGTMAGARLGAGLGQGFGGLF